MSFERSKCKLFPWIFIFQYTALLCWGHMRINLGRGNWTMTEYFLNIPYINITLKQKRCKRMPKHMWSDVNCRINLYRIFCNHISDWLLGVLIPPIINEKEIILSIFPQNTTDDMFLEFLAHRYFQHKQRVHENLCHICE